ncbi:MAG: Co2+/Mg2+ efflux protein ApaG [Planctomycetes bacterium]|nr:Co2+/Mg2+ efflux protein ApaG [Planctomycetota bacterium]
MTVDSQESPAPRSATPRGHSDVTTEGIRVRVGAQYLPGRSDPSLGHFTYAYRVVLTNVGERPAQLLSRHWIVLDADNDRREVRGEGVVGEQPRLDPGQSFEYVSGSSLPTEWGTMEGSYQMIRDDGELFRAAIGRFFLAPTAAPLAAH